MIAMHPWHAAVATFPISLRNQITLAHVSNSIVVQVFTSLRRSSHRRQPLWNSYNAFHAPVSNSYAGSDRYSAVNRRDSFAQT
jgi:hypothetical protein